MKQKQRGSSLIEVLVSLVLLAFGFLGIAGLFNYSVSTNKSTSSRLTAALLAQDYSELVRANAEGVRLGTSYNRDLDGGVFNPSRIKVEAIDTAKLCTYPACTPTTLATHDKEIFKNRIKALLPGGDFMATQVKDAAGNLTYEFDIWILWNEGKTVQDTSTTMDVCPPILANLAASARPNPYPRCFYIRTAL